MNRQEEEYHFKQFVENYSEMPVGNTEFKDRPDVIYTTSEGRTIGIEITECIYDEKAKKKNEDQIKFNNDVIKKLENKLPFNFILNIEINSEIQIKQRNKNSIIDKLVTFCCKEFQQISANNTITYENLDIDWNNLDSEIKQIMLNQNHRELPPEITEISITRFDELEKSDHLESSFGSVPSFKKEDLEKILVKKNKTLKNYTKCDEHWLLIIEGWDFYAYFSDIELIPEIDTEFDKILMFRRWTKEVISIK